MGATLRNIPRTWGSGNVIHARIRVGVGISLARRERKEKVRSGVWRGDTSLTHGEWKGIIPVASRDQERIPCA